ncbi:hypothetical protein CC2G_007754 [Coprinopsis cinerea AmutBmut pab1-1]|nr:hypothetical protein CC2G_007754 [Coprinopsis cinerea AmutBmut pab1-1]
MIKRRRGSKKRTGDVSPAADEAEVRQILASLNSRTSNITESTPPAPESTPAFERSPQPTLPPPRYDISLGDSEDSEDSPSTSSSVVQPRHRPPRIYNTWQQPPWTPSTSTIRVINASPASASVKHPLRFSSGVLSALGALVYHLFAFVYAIICYPFTLTYRIIAKIDEFLLRLAWSMGMMLRRLFVKGETRRGGPRDVYYDPRQLRRVSQRSGKKYGYYDPSGEVTDSPTFSDMTDSMDVDSPLGSPISPVWARQEVNLASFLDATPPKPVKLEIEYEIEAESTSDALFHRIEYGLSPNPRYVAQMKAKARLVEDGEGSQRWKGSPKPKRDPGVEIYSTSWEGPPVLLPSVMRVIKPHFLTSLSITECNVALTEVLGILEDCDILASLEIRNVVETMRDPRRAAICDTEPKVDPDAQMQGAPSSPPSSKVSYPRLKSLSLGSSVSLDPLFTTTRFTGISSVSLSLYDQGNTTDLHAMRIAMGSQWKMLRLRGNVEDDVLEDIMKRRTTLKVDFSRVW